jgi:hypothetical protein
MTVVAKSTLELVGLLLFVPWTLGAVTLAVHHVVLPKMSRKTQQRAFAASVAVAMLWEIGYVAFSLGLGNVGLLALMVLLAACAVAAMYFAVGCLCDIGEQSRAHAAEQGDDPAPRGERSRLVVWMSTIVLGVAAGLTWAVWSFAH